MQEQIKGFRRYICKKERLIFLGLLCIGILVRAIFLGDVPGGLNQDEAFAGYEAYSLLHYGRDSSGYAFPCYFVSWGSGMNVLESYLAIPFVWLFGLTEAAIRMPQFIVACLSLPVVYLLLKELFCSTTALWGLGFMAICPWHIMLSRWGLESNLAPGFLLFGLYFLVKSLKNPRFLVWSALMYGVCLYAYATTWLVVPLTLAIVVIYLCFKRHRFPIKWVLISCGLLFILALPLLLFLLVNQGVVPEIKTAVFSVPKLLYMRGSEVSFQNLFSLQAYAQTFELIFKQQDGLLWNSPKNFGMFYLWTMPFALIGFIHTAQRFVINNQKGVADGKAFILIGAICSFTVCVMINGLNINKSNVLHIYTLIFIAIGLERVFAFLSDWPAIKHALPVALAICFCWFCTFYFGAYNTDLSPHFKVGLGRSVSFSQGLNSKQVFVDPSIFHSQILFYDQTPQPEYQATVKYKNYPSAYLQADRFGVYSFSPDYEVLQKGCAYIAPVSYEAYFMENGFLVKKFEGYLVAY